MEWSIHDGFILWWHYWKVIFFSKIEGRDLLGEVSPWVILSFALPLLPSCHKVNCVAPSCDLHVPAQKQWNHLTLKQNPETNLPLFGWYRRFIYSRNHCPPHSGRWSSRVSVSVEPSSLSMFWATISAHSLLFLVAGNVGLTFTPDFFTPTCLSTVCDFLPRSLCLQTWMIDTSAKIRAHSLIDHVLTWFLL